MYVLNKKTGLKWDVEGELLERLLKSDDYEKVKEVTKTKTPKSGVKKSR
ncbi:hypothetical protein [Mesobacillus sp. S13]|nr:hypothetical protein [Mesobacillus sp. S13]